jgi:hypothetical protein
VGRSCCLLVNEVGMSGMATAMRLKPSACRRLWRDGDALEGNEWCIMRHRAGPVDGEQG